MIATLLGDTELMYPAPNVTASVSVPTADRPPVTTTSRRLPASSRAVFIVTHDDDTQLRLSAAVAPALLKAVTDSLSALPNTVTLTDPVEATFNRLAAVTAQDPSSIVTADDADAVSRCEPALTTQPSCTALPEPRANLLLIPDDDTHRLAPAADPPIRVQAVRDPSDPATSVTLTDPLLAALVLTTNDNVAPP